MGCISAESCMRDFSIVFRPSRNDGRTIAIESNSSKITNNWFFRTDTCALMNKKFNINLLNENFILSRKWSKVVFTHVVNKNDYSFRHCVLYILRNKRKKKKEKEIVVFFAWCRRRCQKGAIKEIKIVSTQLNYVPFVLLFLSFLTDWKVLKKSEEISFFLYFYSHQQ